jgi:hypothetical protein
MKSDAHIRRGSTGRDPRHLPAWLRPLFGPIAISAALHAAAITAIVTIDFLPGDGTPVAAHAVDEVTTSIQLAPSAPTEAAPEIPKPAEAAIPEPEPVPQATQNAPAPEPAPARSEVTVFEQPVVLPPKPAPAAPAVSVMPESRPAQAPPRAPSNLRAPSRSLPAGFAGVHVRQAKRVVYAVDVSGAMAACLDSVMLELRRSIGRLDPDQQFQIVFFRQDLSGEQRAAAIDDNSGRASMLAATPDVKARVDRLLRSARPSGRSAPLAGLKRALELAPDVIFLLTSNIQRSDQGEAGDAAVLHALDELNPRSQVSGRRPVVIKTLQFVEDDPTGLMQAIAAAHGDGPGSYVLLKVAEIESADR